MVFAAGGSVEGVVGRDPSAFAAGWAAERQVSTPRRGRLLRALSGALALVATYAVVALVVAFIGTNETAAVWPPARPPAVWSGPYRRAKFDRFDDASGRQARAAAHFTDHLRRGSLEEVEAGLVLGDVDRLQVADRYPFVRHRLGSSTRSCDRLGQPTEGRGIDLDQVPRHSATLRPLTVRRKSGNPYTLPGLTCRLRFASGRAPYDELQR